MLARGGKAAKAVVTHGDEVAEVVAHADEFGEAAKILEEGLEQAGKEAAESTSDAVIKAIQSPESRGGLRRAMERAGIKPPSGLKKPEVHHDLPWKFKEWFAGESRGLNVNDVQFGRWVEGTPPGKHQNWTKAYERAWEQWMKSNQNATQQQVLEFLDQLLASGKFQ